MATIKINDAFSTEYALYTSTDNYIGTVYVNGQLAHQSGVKFTEGQESGTYVASANRAAGQQAYITIPGYLSKDEPVTYVVSFDGTYVNHLKILGIMEIGYEAFKDCPELSTVVVAPGKSFSNSMAGLAGYAFARCFALTTVDFGRFTGLQSVGDYAFQDCHNLKSIILPNGLKTIGTGAFQGCTSLEYISIPPSVTSISDSAFSGCTSLQQIHLGGVKTIGSSAFYGCKNLKSVTGCLNLTKIGSQAFDKCTWLTSFAFRPSLTNIGAYAFRDCPSLYIMTGLYNTSLRGIGTQAFVGNSGTRVALPESIRFIGSGAFYDTNITYATLPYGKWSGRGNDGNQVDSITVDSSTSTATIGLGLIQRYTAWEYISASTLKPIISISSTSDALAIGVYREAYSRDFTTQATINVVLKTSVDDSGTTYYSETYSHTYDTLKSVVLNAVSAYLIEVRVEFEDGHEGKTLTLVNPEYDESTTALIDE